jgi:uncharacterized protein (TIGR00251 family)
MNKGRTQDLLGCMKGTKDGILIHIEVKPGSKSQGFVGVDEWRGCIEVRVKSLAEKGKANRELIDFLASILSVPPLKIAIIKGKTSRKKEIMIQGLSEKELIERLIGKF